MRGRKQPQHQMLKAKPARGVRDNHHSPIGRAISGVLAASLLTAGALAATSPAYGAVGGGSSGSSQGGNTLVVDHQFSYDEPYGATGTGSYDPPQGVGQASIDAMIAAANTGISNPYEQLVPPSSYYTRMQSDCADALANADARALAIDPTYVSGQSRVIYMWWAANTDHYGNPWENISLVRPQINGWFAGGQSGTSIRNFDEPFSVSGSTTFGQAIQNEALAQAESTQAATPGGGISAICVAANPYEPPAPNYDLTVTTTVGSAPTQAGGTGAAYDIIHASNNGSSIVENISGRSILHYTDVTGKSSSVTKNVTITNNGDTNGPSFTPADLGMEYWRIVDYWFDFQADKQGKMKAAVDTPDKDPKESFTVVSTPPDQDATKTITKGTSADSMVNSTTITTKGGIDGTGLMFTDVINSFGQTYTVSNQKIMVDGKDITSIFTLNTPNGQAAPGDTVTATFDPSKTADGLVPGNQSTYVFTLDVTVSLPATSKVQDTPTVNWTGKGVADWESKPPAKEFPTWSFTPDKVWIVQDASGNWVAAIDPSWSNKAGADTKTFLNGSVVGTAVNGTIPADLAQAPKTLTIVDDYTAADYIWDPTPDTSKVRVYAQNVTDDQKSSVANIVKTGTDIASKGTVTLNATAHTVTFTFGSEYLATLKGGKSAIQITMVVPGVADYANKGVDTPAKIEAGNAQALTDFGKEAGDELSFCVNPDGKGGATGASLTNSGSEQVNNQKKSTNTPSICGYVPPVEKDVLSDAAQGGTQLSIDGKTVTPGQLVMYKLTTTPDYTPTLGYPISAIGIDETYSQYTTAVKSSVIVTDKTLGVLPVAYYKITWDDKNHGMTITLTETGVAAMMKSKVVPSFTVTFEAKVNKDAPSGTTIDNEWTLILDKSRTKSNIVTNKTPTDTPSKSVTSTENRVSVNGKTFLVGEKGTYWVTIKKETLSNGNAAYAVQQFGGVDTPDTSVLKIDPDSFRALDPAGKDASGKFASYWDGTTWYFAAKLESTYIPITGETVDQTATALTGVTYAPNTETRDLPGYLKVGVDGFDPLKTANIDSTLVDGSYMIGFDFTVTKLTDKSVVNTATQILNGIQTVSNQVANPIKDINPTKDVVVNVGDDSANDATIINGSNFLYALNSSILPANRVYAASADWTMVDQFDLTHDHYTGQWAVYTSRDLYSSDGKSLLAATGTRIAGSGFTPTDRALKDLFTFTYSDDGVGTLTASKAYLDAVAENTHEAGFTLYVQMLRIAPGDVVNSFTETHNGKDRVSNEVVTHTPEETPAITLEKYDVATGVDLSGDEGLGNRDDQAHALIVRPGQDIQIGYLITNTGTLPLTSLTLTDDVTMGDGTVKDIAYPDDWTTLVLAPGASITILATLTGVTQTHTNVATVTAVPILPCPIVDANPWDDKPAAPSGCTPTCSDGSIPTDGTCGDGSTPTSTCTCSDGTTPGGDGTCADGSTPNGPCCASCADGSTPSGGTCADGTTPSGGMCADGSVPTGGTCSDGSKPTTDGKCADGSTPANGVCADGSVPSCTPVCTGETLTVSDPWNAKAPAGDISIETGGTTIRTSGVPGPLALGLLGLACVTLGLGLYGRRAMTRRHHVGA